MRFLLSHKKMQRIVAFSFLVLIFLGFQNCTGQGSLNGNLGSNSLGSSGVSGGNGGGGGGGGGNGPVINAASCSQADVNAVINGPLHTAVDGDTIQIPRGSCTWNSGIYRLQAMQA